MRVNLLGTANVVEAANENLATLERFLDFSTSEVFGRHAYKVEETHETSGGSVGEARWTYAVSKLAGEYLSHAYFDEFKLPAAGDPALQHLRAEPGRSRGDPPLRRAGAARRGPDHPR
jgi:nucleoside-diphosphate-sugar epimerase